MAKWSVSYEPPTLPMTTTVCTNCGQWLDHEEVFKGADLPYCFPKTQGTGGLTDPSTPQPPPDEIEWICFCPRCNVDLSDTPPRKVIIMYADTFYPTYPTIKDLIEEMGHLEKEIRTHTARLHKHRERRALAGPLSSEGIKHEIAEEQLQEEISTLRQNLDTIRKEVQNKLESPRP